LPILAKILLNHSVAVSKKFPTPEDAHLFRQSIGMVKRVENDKWLLKTEPKPKPKPLPKTDFYDIEEKLKPEFEIVTEKLMAEDTFNFLAPGLQKNVLKKLRQGYYGADAQLDLHGLTSIQAKQQLLRFLYLCVEDGCRCVHIIHGKGYRSENNQPVLKNHLNQWLRQHNDVQAFCSALPKEGGAGAVLVLLHLSEKYTDW
jgi:DNA-nicking Smr family endonuclease